MVVKELLYSMSIQLPDANKVAILFTGGVESYLLGLLSVKKYGAKNIVFVLFTMDAYNVFYTKPDKVKKITKDFYDSVAELGGLETIIINNEKYDSFDGWLADRTWSIIKNEHPDVEYVMGGYNNIHLECYKAFKEIDFPNNQYASHDARILVLTEPESYPELHEAITLCNGVIYFVEDDYTYKRWQDIDSIYNHPNLKAPLINLKKEEVLQVYYDQGIIDKVYATRSCNVENKIMQCGVCKNCLSRKLAFSNAGIEDKTLYEL